MEIQCDYCGNGFSSKTSLLTHQKTSKYCLTSRDEESDVQICADCNKSFTQKSTLVRHHKTCKLRAARLLFEDRIVKLEADNERLKVFEAENVKLNASLKDIQREKDKLAEKLTRLEIELDVRGRLAGCASSTSQSSTKDRLPRVRKIPSFFCTVDNVLPTISGYKFREGIVGLIKFIIPMIQDGKMRCYVRTDPTRLHYQRFDGKDWAKDRNGLFIREILDVMKPHVKQKHEEFIEDSRNLAKFNQTQIHEMQRDLIPLGDIAHGIIHSDGKSRKVLIDDIAAKLAHITDI